MPLSVEMCFYFRNKVCGDIDNLIGGVLDAHIVVGGKKQNVFPNDAYVYRVIGEKVFGEDEGVWIQVRRFE